MMLQTMIRSILWLLLGLLWGVAHGQPATFDTLYTQGHIGYALMPNSQGYAIAGNHHNEDFWLFQIDEQGRIQWERTYGRRYGLFDAVTMYDAAAFSDGYFLTGRSYSIPDTNWGKFFGYVVKVDAQGNQLWDKLFYTTYDSSRSSTFYNVTPTPDGGCLLTGNIFMGYSDTLYAPTRFWIVKLDSLGGVEFEKIYHNGPAHSTYDDGTSDGLVLPNEQGYLIGTTYSNGSQAYLMHLDLNGDTIQTIKYEPQQSAFDYRYVFREIEQTDGGEFILTGQNVLLRLRDNFSVIDAQYDNWVLDHLREVDTREWLGNNINTLVKFDAQGQVLWQRRDTSYNLDPVDFIRFVEIIPAQDEGLLILYNNLSGLGLMKTDCEGNLVNPVACATTSAPAAQPSFGLDVARLPDRWRISYAQPVQDGQLQLCNLMGQVLETAQMVSAQGATDFVHTHLSPGLYLLQLRDSQGRLLGSRKVIKY